MIECTGASGKQLELSRLYIEKLSKFAHTSEHQDLDLFVF